MPRSLVVFVLLFVAFPASAQDDVAWERFFPYQIGDRVQYLIEERSCFALGQCEESESYRTFEVVGEVEIEEGVALVFQTGESQCAVGIGDGDLWFSVDQLQGDECLPIVEDHLPDTEIDTLTYVFNTDEPLAPITVEVGQESYTVDAIKIVGVSPIGRYEFAADIGLVERFRERDSRSSRTTYTLTYAEVGNAVYGGAPVVGEEGITPTSFDLGAAYPNPFRSSSTLALSLPAAEAVVLEAFDVLGRRVLRRDLGIQSVGTSRHTIDGTTLRPGVYVVRVTTASGQQATRRLIRVE